MSREGWGALFDRADHWDVSIADVRAAVSARRATRETDDADDEPTEGGEAARVETRTDDDRPDPATVVADADVLVADLLVGGAAREAMDDVRAHDWVRLAASEPLLADAAGAIADLADESLAADWGDTVRDLAVLVAHPTGDHPGLASARAGRAAHLLTFEESLRSARTNAAIKPHVEVSVKHPDAFARLFDPAALYGTVREGPYPGPDRDPRA